MLILSRFAGAAEEMTDALLINPFSREEISDALSRALAMPLAERKDRWQSLMQVVRDSDVALWRDQFVSTLRAIPAGGSRLAPEV